MSMIPPLANGLYLANGQSHLGPSLVALLSSTDARSRRITLLDLDGAGIWDG